MNYEEWRSIYIEILADFGFSEEEDRSAAELLARLVRRPLPLRVLESLISGRRVNVFGAGPSLERLEHLPEGTAIACDGATSFLLERGAVPEIIVTDLDGRVEDLLEANARGSVVVIHAHGDNRERLRRYAPLFVNAIATTQAQPLRGVHNFGGFTDGDRAVFLAEHFNAKEIYLYGMDFHSEVGRYSFSRDSERKRKKLLWAERLIKLLEKRGAPIRWVK
ncbi:MAG: DUF115 domain-containing protein [Euryarchaeota archaeon]|nr:DUF115 domain-containing protein [Euryarchaeota archaeon]